MTYLNYTLNPKTSAFIELSIKICDSGDTRQSRCDKEQYPAIIEGPYYKGVTALGASGVDLLLVAKCKEEDIYQVQRDMNREIKLLFDAKT